MSALEISLFIILTSLAGIFVVPTAVYHADGLPTKSVCYKEGPNEDSGPLQVALVIHHHNDANSLKSYLAGVNKCLANQLKTMASCGTTPGEPEPSSPTWTNPCDMNGICCPPNFANCD